MRFHRRCGDRVTLLNDNTTAVRNFVEFNHGLILSAEPLKDDVMFEVCIDRKVNVWNGSLEIGVTTLDPEFMELPATATKLRNTAWIMSGSSIVKDGVTLVNSYGPELDTLTEGDCVGVMRSGKGELLFYVNSRCLGVAAKDLPVKLFAVIDLYGQCVQASITHVHGMRSIMETSIDQLEEDPNNDDTLTSSDMDVVPLPPDPSQPKPPQDVYVPMIPEGACALVAQDRLRFHPRCGILVKLSANNKSAERARPLDDYNNGVVMTHRPLYDNELFEIRIDRLVDKWSGSIEVGVTSHNPATIRFPSTMTNMDSGTIMMSGCKVLMNGHGMCMEYGNFNLDELREGDTVGMMRKSTGKLHYFINGVDQGIATDKVDQQVWGVVDLYGMTVKVTIVDPCEDMDTTITNAPVVLSAPDLPAPSRIRQRLDEDSLLFHTLRDSNVIIINDGKTAHRPNAFEYFNNGIVMTNRTLRTNELFQVRLDLVIPKWAGSIEIGVTQHSSNDLLFPYKMSNAKSGTWAMTGEDVIRDGTTIIPQYVRNLNRLVEGDTVGVMRKDMGILHFFVNGVDQGPAAFNIPEHVFGLVDLYGRVAQATIVEAYTPPAAYSPESPLSTESNATIYPEMCFHRLHGRNARLSRSRLTASRATVYSEFNDAVLFSSRPLRECDMFELRIDKMVDCWIGSLEIGVTAIRPDDLEANGGVGAIAGTATDLNWDTYILSGAAMMKDGECVRSGYPLDLDTLTVGSRVGMMWHADRSLHYYLDGMDMGKAWYVPHLNIYAVVDLYGQCTQVTILQNEERAFNYNGCTNSDNSLLSNSRALSSPPPPYWSFSEYCGDNICIMHDYSFARRLTADPTAALVFSSAHLAVGEIFEVKIVECKSGYAGSLRMGVTDINILNVHVNRSLPPTVALLPHYTAYIDGKYMKYSRHNEKEHSLRSFVPSFDWLRPGDRVGLKKTNDGRVLVYYNSELLETAFENVPDKVYVVMEIFGHVTKIQAISKGANVGTALPQHTIPNDEYVKPPPLSAAAKNATNASVAQSVQNNANNETAAQAHVEVTEDANEESSHSTELASSNAELGTRALGASSDTLTVPTESTLTVVSADSRRRRNPLPYTFHYVHGKNIKLCSSDTVAMRTSGYKDGIAIVSQPLRRGHNFRFRVDKVGGDWSGSISLGAVGALPADSLPQCAMHLDPPIWAVTSDLLHDNGTFKKTQMASAFDELTEQSVLTIHFRFNSELVVDVDGGVVGVVGVVPRAFSHVYPLIDLYGRVHQVSVLLHPTVVASGASLDLPIIAENLREESLAELELLDDDEEDDKMPKLTPETPEIHPKRKAKAYSHDNLLEDSTDPLYSQPGPSTHPDPPTQSLPNENDAKNKQIKCKKVCSNRTVLHQSLIITPAPIDNNESANRCIQKSHSTHSFCQLPDENNLDVESKDELRHTFSAESRMGEEPGAAPDACDTNIRHNDRYPEASEVDSLDTEIMDALALDAGNLPDLTEEHSSSIDDSTRRDDLFTESLSVENLNYLNRILCLDQQSSEGQSLEAEWEARGESCEHLHVVLKYWHFLVLPYPELRRAVSSGQLRCYCRNCQPDAPPPLAEREVQKKSSKGQYFLEDSESDDSDCHFYKIESDGDDPYYVTLAVQNIKCKFEVDTGSKISAISKNYYHRCFSHLPLQTNVLCLKSYIGNPIETCGYLDVEVAYGNKVEKLKLYVIENGGPPLMGRTWIKRFKLIPYDLDCFNMKSEDSMAESLKREFPEVFAEGLGTFGSRLQLRLNDDTPVFVKARALPLALRDRVEQELDRLQREGVIYKVDRSEYGTPIVPVVKTNGAIRICGDYKITINPLLKDFHYPLPRIEDLFALLGGGEQYTKLDLSNAFQQCVLEEESQPMTAITTHVGTFVYRRVPFGIKCIPENFQKIMEETLSGLPSTAVFADDICVTGKDKATHMANLRAVLQRLKDNGLRINFSKCQFFKASVNYLGYRIDKYGLHTDERKIAAIVNAPAPSNVTQLKSFMGLVNFYAKFCANMSDILKPMYSLLKKNVKWNWDEFCDKAFKKIKKVLSSSPVLVHYNPSLPLILSVDSSPYGLGAVLTQRGADGVERPLCCASRTLNAAECNYSQLDKEALAILFGVTKHHQYVYGRKFTLRTDHRALSYIFGKNKGLPVTAASRLQRYAVKLSAYDFNIEFIRSERNCYADALSRLPLVSKIRSGTEDEGCSYLNFVEGDFPLSFKEIKSELAKDPVLSKIYGYVMFGWPNNSNESEKPYFNRKDSLNIDQGCLIWGYRVVIPKSLRVAVLNELHSGHPGIVKMKQIARNYVWWDTLDADIERVAEQCAACRAQRPAPAPAPLHSWPWPQEPWARLNMDFLGPFNNVYYLVIIDAHSKWIEVEKIKTISASIVIDCLRKLFARFGLPKQIVSDNGPPYSSAEFGSYLKRNGIRHTLVAPYHPASNGAAENAVRTIKRVLKKAVIENENDVTALSRFLFTYRNTEHSTTKKEPAVALLGRRLRGRLDLLRPDAADVVRTAQQASERRSEGRALREAEPGTAVLVRDYARGAHKWAEGKVLTREGPVSYAVRTSDGRIHKRHVDQLHFRKSRFTVSEIDTKTSNATPVCDQVGDKDQVEIPEISVSPANDTGLNCGQGGGEDEYSTPPGSPIMNDERPRRKAAVRCVERLKQM